MDKSLDKWQQLFEFEIKGRERIDERRVEVARLSLDNGPAVELVSGIGEESLVAKFIKDKGGGLHHLCFEVEDIHESIQVLKSRGIEFVEPVPVRGAEGSTIAFIQPSHLNGILVELKQKGSDSSKNKEI
jgi:methylmalonyl-CoA/ethylmalonyl-CoA epimerase